MKTATTSILIATASIVIISFACTETRVMPATPPRPVFEPMDFDDETLAAVEDMLQQEPANDVVTTPQTAFEQLDAAVIWTAQSALLSTPAEGSPWTAALTRGVRVDVVVGSRTDNGFVRVRLIDGSCGFVHESDIILGEVDELLAFENSPVYDEPNDQYPPRASLSKGTPLFVLGSTEQWVEVLLPGGERGWMLNTDLARDPEELTAARS